VIRRVYDSGRFQVSDLATTYEQCRLVTESRPTFVGVACPEHGVDESVPVRIPVIGGHGGDRMGADDGPDRACNRHLALSAARAFGGSMASSAHAAYKASR
jgi:hypothetical protein